jgi:hypothetical protein
MRMTATGAKVCVKCRDIRERKHRENLRAIRKAVAQDLI